MGSRKRKDIDIKNEERDGYSAIQFGFGEKSERLTRKPDAGQFARAKTTPKRFVREIRLDPEQTSLFSIGQTVTVSQVFKAGDKVDVTGVSKGKGFQGVMKRHHFGGFKATHGTHEYFRHGGSIGCRLTPGRVVKGKKMAGQLGNKRVTVQNVTVIDVDDEKNLLMLGGGIPGAPSSYLVLKQAAKRPPRSLRLETPAAEPPPVPEAEAPAEG